MRFKTFLLESEQSLAKFRKNLNIMIDRELLLFRKQQVQPSLNVANVEVTTPSGAHDWTFNAPIYLYPKRETARSSMTGDDAFLDLSVANWKDFPDRRYSTFTTQKGSHTNTFFGKFGIVIPSDDIELFGFSPTDFNDYKSNSAPSQFRNNMEMLMVNVKMILHHMRLVLDNIEKGNEFRNFLLDALVDKDLQDFVSDYTFKMNAGNKIMQVASLMDWSIKKYSEFKKLSSKEEIETNLLEAIFNLAQALVRLKFSSCVEAFESVSPTNYKAKSFTSISQVPVKSSANEVWFVGDFLFVELPLSANHIKKETAINVLKSLRDMK